jgi:hypothetical protein
VFHVLLMNVVLLHIVLIQVLLMLHVALHVFLCSLGTWWPWWWWSKQVLCWRSPDWAWGSGTLSFKHAGSLFLWIASESIEAGFEGGSFTKVASTVSWMESLPLLPMS